MADKWPLRLLTLAAWALAAWSATYWVLQLQGSRPPAAAPAFTPTRAASAEPTHVSKLFGPAIEPRVPELAAPVVVDPSTRFSLVGVVAGRAKSGVALLSVEGKPARPYRVGATIENAYTLKSVTSRSATLATSDSGDTFTVNIAAPGSSGPATSPAMPALPARGNTGLADPAAPATTPAPGIPMPRFGPIPAASMSRRSG